MDIFSAGTAVTLSVPLQDRSGNPLSVTAVEYLITDEEGAQVSPAYLLDDFSPGSSEATIVVSAAENTLAAGVARGLRNLSLTCTVGGNRITIRAAYAIQAEDPLVVGVNSFMSYAQAEFTALSLPNLGAWNGADEQTRIAALIDARSHICQLSFNQLNSNVNWGQDSLNYVPEGRYDTDYIGTSSMFLFNGNLDLLRPDQFAALPTRFVDALKRAQVVEADSILGGNGIEQKRREGLTQDDIGESRQSFRATKPLELPVCRRALGYLSLYVTFAKRIGRG